MSDQTAVLIPVFNNIDYLPELMERIPESVKEQVVFINDGSSDGTGEWIEKHHVKTIHFSVNRGKGAALKAGIQEAENLGYNFVIHLDSDLQHPPEMIPEFQPQHNELVYGYRTDRRNMPIHRRVSNFLTSLFITVRSGVIVRDSQCGYRGFSINDYRKFHICENRFHFESELMLKMALYGIRLRHVIIPTIYVKESSAIHNVRDTLQFVWLWFRSYLWT
ncbi:MAG: glycosyltransferase family 2 protein [FCB group bacterium]|nr:glycosyltransferase family 2 protein [FCB group bacterium]